MLAWLALRVLWLVALAGLLPSIAGAVPVVEIDQAGETVSVPLETVPLLVWGVVSAVAALLAAVIPASKMPKWLRALLDLAGSNWGEAKNAAQDVQVPPSGPRASGGHR